MVNFEPNANISQQPVPPQKRSEFSEISQNHFQANSQSNVNTPTRDIPPPNQHEFSEDLQSSLNQVHLADPKAQRTKRNVGARRNIMRNRNNEQICELQDVRVWETSKKHPHDVHTREAPRVHQQNNWWPTNQADTTSYLQLPPRRFQEQRQ